MTIPFPLTDEYTNKEYLINSFLKKNATLILKPYDFKQLAGATPPTTDRVGVFPTLNFSTTGNPDARAASLVVPEDAIEFPREINVWHISESHTTGTVALVIQWDQLKSGDAPDTDTNLDSGTSTTLSDLSNTTITKTSIPYNPSGWKTPEEIVGFRVLRNTSSGSDTSDGTFKILLITINYQALRYPDL